MGLALRHQFQIFIRGQIAERKLQGLEGPGLNGLVGYFQPVVGDADVPDVSLLFGSQGRGVRPFFIFRVGHDGRVVELEQIDVIRLQSLQGCFDVFRHRCIIGASALGGDDNVPADVMQRCADFFFAVGIHVGCIKIIDSVVICFA